MNAFKKKIPISTIYLILAFFTSLLLIYAVMSFYPYRNVEYKKNSFVTNKLVYKQGETGYYTVNYCKFNGTVPTVRKFFVDGIRLEMSNQIASLKEGCHEAQIAFTVPNINPDRYRIEIEASYKHNIFQKEYVSKSHTNWFDIVKECE